MSADELQELSEHAEKAREDRSLAAVSLTMAVVAVCVAIVSLLGHRAHTEEVVMQAKASDQWAFYQAKSIRRHADEQFTDMASVTTTKDAAAMAKLREKYSSEAERYKSDQEGIQEKATEMEKEVATEMKRADRFDLAEVFLEIGLVITSITLLSGKRLFWFLGMVMGVVGVVAAATVMLLH